MPDANTTVGDNYWTVDTVSQLTGRHPVTIRGWIRSGRIKSVQDTLDGRRRLIPVSEIAVILARPKHGRRLKKVLLSKSDGSTIARTIPVPRKPEGATR